MDMVQNARVPSDLNYVYDLTLTLIQYGANPSVSIDNHTDKSECGLGGGGPGPTGYYPRGSVGVPGGTGCIPTMTSSLRQSQVRKGASIYDDRTEGGQKILKFCGRHIWKPNYKSVLICPLMRDDTTPRLRDHIITLYSRYRL